MKILIQIVWFLLVAKCLLFWLWLWQLKEYHWGRFKAHFETLGFRKLISSYHRLKFPKMTGKIIVILFFGLILEVIALFFDYYILLIGLIACPIVFSLFVLLFQIPTFVLRKIILKKAENKRQQFKELLVIGITGSYGKTSTKDYLAEILSSKFKVLKTEQHVNSEIGIAQTILNKLSKKHQIFIVEMGAYNRGKIKEVCQMIKPSIGILTGINEQHMSCFGSLENIIKAKYELIECLPKNGLAVFNGNNEYCSKLFQKTNIPKKLVCSDNKLWDEENLSMANAVAKILGVKSNVKVKNPIKKNIKGLNIFKSTYSANPHSVMAHLNYLKTLPGKKVIVMPCLIELGKASKKIHREIGKKINEVCDLGIITTKDRFKQIKVSDKIIFLSNPDKIFDKIKEIVQPGDTILLESRVPQKLINLLL